MSKPEGLCLYLQRERALHLNRKVAKSHTLHLGTKVAKSHTFHIAVIDQWKSGSCLFTQSRERVGLAMTVQLLKSKCWSLEIMGDWNGFKDYEVEMWEASDVRYKVTVGSHKHFGRQLLSPSMFGVSCLSGCVIGQIPSCCRCKIILLQGAKLSPFALTEEDLTQNSTSSKGELTSPQYEMISSWLQADDIIGT